MPSDPTPNIFRRAASSVADFFIVWWREASGPLRRSQYRTLAGAVTRRVLLWTPPAVLVLLLVGALGFYLFTGWRARDLAAKAVANAESGQDRLARLQIYSASSLRPAAPEVRRASVLIESRLGNPAAVTMWEELGDEFVLTDDETDARAEAMTMHGSDGQFQSAMGLLAERGKTRRAAELRSVRSMRRGNVEEAILHARTAAAAEDAEPAEKLRLLELLALRHGPFLSGEGTPGPLDLAAAGEMSALVDQLAGTPSAPQALAFGLQSPFFPAAKKSEWADAAWRDARAGNEALLPAADFLIATGAETAGQLHGKLNVIFLGAPLPRQAAFAAWLLRHGKAPLVLGVVSPAEAAQDESMFTMRAAALTQLERWEDLYRLAGAPTKAAAAVRLMVQARAARELDRRGEGSDLVKAALRQSVEEGRFVQAVQMADAEGLRGMADEAILEMCGNAMVADGAFRLARDRFERRGQFASLDQAFATAQRTAPSAPSVVAYQRYRELLDGAEIDPSVTAAAVQNGPADMGARFNHALALLQAGRGEEALAVFEDYDVIVERLPPGLRALSAAVMHAAGDPNAVVVAREIDPALLTPAEYRLIAELRTAGF